MRKIYACATEGDVVLAFEDRLDAEEYAGGAAGAVRERVRVPGRALGDRLGPNHRRDAEGRRVAMGIICESCGRDIDALGQDNMSCTSEPLCEDCWNEQQSYTNDIRREVRNLRFESARLREKLDAAMTEGTAVQNLRKGIETAYEVSRERALALTKLDECELWLGRCEPKETAAPTLKGAAQEAAMPCLKDDGAHGFAMPDVSVEINAEKVAETVAKSLRESMQPALRMAVR